MERKHYYEELKTASGEIYLSFTYDPQGDTLEAAWSWNYEYGFDYIKKGSLLLLEHMKKNNLTKAVENLTKIEGTWDPINDWIVNVQLPLAHEAGAQYWALIHPQEFFANLASELMSEQLVMESNGITFFNASSEEEAFNWLGAQKSKTMA